MVGNLHVGHLNIIISWAVRSGLLCWAVEPRIDAGFHQHLCYGFLSLYDIIHAEGAVPFLSGLLNAGTDFQHT